MVWCQGTLVKITLGRFVTSGENAPFTMIGSMPPFQLAKKIISIMLQALPSGNGPRIMQAPSYGRSITNSSKNRQQPLEKPQGSTEFGLRMAAVFFFCTLGNGQKFCQVCMVSVDNVKICTHFPSWKQWSPKQEAESTGNRIGSVHNQFGLSTVSTCCIQRYGAEW